MNISVVIPNFNGEEILKKNFLKVLKTFVTYKDGLVEIIVTDDASKDNSVSYIKDCIKTNSSRVAITLLENHQGGK